MLNTAKTLMGYKLDSLDGEIGSVKEFYFDDQHWAIRYLVADAGDWLTGTQVLISPYALGVVNQGKRSISINLTNQQIEESPPLASDKPVSRQFELSWPGKHILISPLWIESIDWRHRHGRTKSEDGRGNDAAHDAAHADGQGLHVAMSNDEGHAT